MKSLYLLLNSDLCEASFQPTFHQGTRVFVQMSWERQEMRVGAQQNPNDVHFCLSVALLPISRSGHSRQSARHSKLVGRGTIYFSQMTQTAEGTAHCIETPCYTMKAWPVTPDLRLVTLLSVNYNQWMCISIWMLGMCTFPSLWAHWALCHPVLLYHNAGWNLLRPNPQS